MTETLVKSKFLGIVLIAAVALSPPAWAAKILLSCINTEVHAVSFEDINESFVKYPRSTASFTFSTKPPLMFSAQGLQMNPGSSPFKFEAYPHVYIFQYGPVSSGHTIRIDRVTLQVTARLRTSLLTLTQLFECELGKNRI